MAVTTASLMAVQLAACGNSETQTVEEYPLTTSNQVTEDQNQAITSDEIESVYNSEMAEACDEWQEGDDGSFECIDENSPYYAQHFFNGLMYATAGAMIGSAIYKSRNLKMVQSEMSKAMAAAQQCHDRHQALRMRVNQQMV